MRFVILVRVSRMNKSNNESAQMQTNWNSAADVVCFENQTSVARFEEALYLCLFPVTQLHAIAFGSV